MKRTTVAPVPILWSAADLKENLHIGEAKAREIMRALPRTMMGRRTVRVLRSDVLAYVQRHVVRPRRAWQEEPLNRPQS